MQVTYLQKYAYEVANMGYNMFITGNAGTGKSFIINKFILDKENQGLNVMKLAPTGIAASNINGVTLHSQFDMPLGPLVKFNNSYDNMDEVLVETDIIIIDEISMCRLDMFDFVGGKILRANRIRKNRGKKVIQLIVVGDFFQLPPVIKENERDILSTYYGNDIGSGFAFQSKLWSIFEFKYVILTEVIRQTNRTFLDHLNKVRVGDKSSLDYFLNNCSKFKLDNAITLCGRNNEVRKINLDKLNKLPGDIVEYRAILDGEVNHNDTIAEFNLELKIGARVMTLVNQDGYNNGSFGTVIKLENDIIYVNIDNSGIVGIHRYEWKIYKYDIEQDDLGNYKLIRNCIGTYVQFPIKLAYAITIHKSQGQTYDYVNLDPYCWDCGQLYTALSRVKNLENMYISYDIDSTYEVVSLSAIKFNNEMVKTANQTVKPMENKELVKTDIDNDMNKISGLLRGIGKK